MLIFSSFVPLLCFSQVRRFFPIPFLVPHRTQKAIKVLLRHILHQISSLHSSPLNHRLHMFSFRAHFKIVRSFTQRLNQSFRSLPPFLYAFFFVHSSRPSGYQFNAGCSDIFDSSGRHLSFSPPARLLSFYLVCSRSAVNHNWYPIGRIYSGRGLPVYYSSFHEGFYDSTARRVARYGSAQVGRIETVFMNIQVVAEL